MVGIVDINGKVLKHYAQDTINRKRYIIIALCNENDPETCSVVNIDDLEPSIRSELVALVNSPEGQSVEEIWPILDRKYFLDYPKATMLKVLKAMRKILVIKSDQVAVQLPGEQTMTPKQVHDAINAYKSQKKEVVHQTFNPAETEEVAEVKPVVQEVVKSESSDLSELKEGISSLDKKMGALLDSLSALTGALVDQKKSKKK